MAGNVPKSPLVVILARNVSLALMLSLCGLTNGSELVETAKRHNHAHRSKTRQAIFNVLEVTENRAPWIRQVPAEDSSEGCHPLCNIHGTCNEELGRCDCPSNRSGVDCSVHLHQACEAQPGYVTPCHAEYGGVPTCECAFQCDKHGHVKGLLPSCLARVEDLDPNQQGKALNVTLHHLNGDRVEVAFKRSSPPLFEATLGAVRPNVFKQKQLLALERCPESCNFAGVCLLDLLAHNTLLGKPRCHCHEDRSGPSCKNVVPSFCMNQCSGRGHCDR
ncbi:hypothetical protein CYMTET_27275, partial [Cymbomonas tetramitiformis]